MCRVATAEFTDGRVVDSVIIPTDQLQLHGTRTGEMPSMLTVQTFYTALRWKCTSRPNLQRFRLALALEEPELEPEEPAALEELEPEVQVALEELEPEVQAELEVEEPLVPPQSLLQAEPQFPKVQRFNVTTKLENFIAGRTVNFDTIQTARSRNHGTPIGATT